MSFVKSVDLGQSLLKQTREESLQDLLVSLQETSFPDSSKRGRHSLHHPVLDRMLNTVEHHGANLTKAPVLELTSATPASGKTQLLYLLIAATALPETIQHDRPQTEPAVVIVLDADGTFSVDRLKLVMLARLQASLKDTSIENESLNFLVDNSLRHVHIFHPQSLASLSSTIQNLPEYLLNLENHSSENRSFDLLVLDSMSAFYWQHSLAEELSEQDDVQERESNEKADEYRSLVQRLRHLQQQFGAAIVSTQWGLSSPSRNHPEHAPSLRSLLPFSWQALCTLRVILDRDRVKRFPPGIGIEQALNEADDRQAVVDQSRFTGRVALFDVNHRDDVLQTQLTSHPENGSFSFRVTENDVFFLP